MFTYDESSIIARLHGLSREQIAAFAYGCARRTAALAEDEEVASAVTHALRCLRNVLEARDSSDTLVSSLKSLDAIEVDSDAHASASYALRAFLGCSPQEAAWAARRAYESRDQIAYRDLDADFETPDAEFRIMAHPSIQRELRAQNDDLVSITSGKVDVVIQRDD